MADLSPYFKITIKKDRMNAQLHFTKEYVTNRDIVFSVDSLYKLLSDHHIK